MLSSKQILFAANYVLSDNTSSSSSVFSLDSSSASSSSSVFSLDSSSSSSSSRLEGWYKMGSNINGSSAGANFGNSVELSRNGMSLVVGAPNESNVGAVRSYAWSGSEWQQKGSTIIGSNSGDRTGWSVSFDASGETLAIGSPFSDANGTNSGKTEVYSWNGSGWVLKGQVILGEASGDQSGHSLDLSDDGETVVIGALYNDGAGTSSGSVRVYVWGGSSWIQRGSDMDGSPGDLSGYSVSGDGNVLAIGSIFNDVSGSNAGVVRAYYWNGSSWARKGNDLYGENAGDQSGFSVSMSGDGNIVAIGAPFNDGSGSNSGHVRVYFWNGSSWIQRGLDINGEARDDGSGYDININEDGSVLAIGAIYNDGGGTNSGHVRVYVWNGSSWIQRGLDIDGENPGDQSGSGKSVSLDRTGGRVAIGAPYNDTNGAESGHVRVFSWG